MIRLLIPVPCISALISNMVHALRSRRVITPHGEQDAAVLINADLPAVSDPHIVATLASIALGTRILALTLAKLANE